MFYFVTAKSHVGMSGCCGFFDLSVEENTEQCFENVHACHTVNQEINDEKTKLNSFFMFLSQKLLLKTLGLVLLYEIVKRLL